MRQAGKEEVDILNLNNAGRDKTVKEMITMTAGMVGLNMPKLYGEGEEEEEKESTSTPSDEQQTSPKE